MPRYDLATGVLLLAHRRLKTLARALLTKENLADVEIDVAHNRGPVAHAEIEARARRLVDAAVAMLEDGPPIPLPPAATLGFGVSRAVVTGTAAFTLPSLVALEVPDRAWFRDAIRRGSADPDLSRLAVPSTEFVLDVGRRALGHATSDDERRRIRGLVLGMLADVAARVVVGPVLRGAAALESPREPDLSVTPAAIQAGALTADRLMGGRAGAAWQDWWLPPAEVPDAFFQGFAEAISALDAVITPLGFRARLDGFPRGAPLTADQLATAYRMFQGGRLSIFHPGVPGYGTQWSLWEWWAIMIPVFIGPPVALALALATDRSKLLFPPKPPAAPTAPADATSWLELAAWGGLASSIAPLVYKMLMWTGYPGPSYPFWEGIGAAVLRAVFGIVGLTAGTDTSLRTWMLVLQLAPDMIALVQAIVEGILGHRGAALLMSFELAAAVGLGLTMIAGAALHGAGATASWDSFFPGWLIVLVVCLLLAFAAGAIVHAAGGLRLVLDDGHWDQRTLPPGAQVGTLPGPPGADPRASALVFEDSTLFRIPGQGGNAPTRADFAYPSGSRTLLRLVWAGRTPLTMKVDGARLVFKIAGDPELPVVVPPGATPQALADLLTATVLDGGARKLTVTQAADQELQPRLPFPATLADPGDEGVSLAEHDAHRGDATIVSTTADQPTLLRHAPRVHNGARYGVAGPERTQLETWKIVPSAQLGDADVTAMGHAAELASLLFLGAAVELAPAPIAAPGGDLRPVYEVFRRWNLDERSANEWRRLVAGGARSERVGAVDPLRRPAPGGATVADDPGGRDLLERAGWIATWRAWTRVAADPTQDATAPRPAPYTPPAGAPPSTAAPTNDLLTRAVRVLLNL